MSKSTNTQRPSLTTDDLATTSTLSTIGPSYYYRSVGGGGSNEWVQTDQPQTHCACPAVLGHHMPNCQVTVRPSHRTKRSGHRTDHHRQKTKQLSHQVTNWDPIASYVCGCRVPDGHQTACPLAGRV